ncbi:hypothetical protein KQX54_002113 [Cotesia glomerata]|uniref:Odorant receptor n=2 Tax=Cotesia glomerata TaxID=32391 RepID=A0AAV7IHJ1_COTGL|nr:hypothetical protein KQX54_002113 [Cotesia glomerata]
MYVEPATVVHILSILGRLTSIWPPDPKISRVSKLAREFLWSVFFLNVIALLVPLILGAYFNRKEIISMMKSLSELTALGDVFFNLLICKIQRRQLYILLTEISDYIKLSKGNEMVIFQKYVSRYFSFCAFVGLSYFQTAIAFSCGPIFMKQILPADTWYPFDIKPFTTRHYVIYFQQILAILQTGLGITVDFTVALLLSYSSTRLEILSQKLEEVSSNEELKICIIEHQNCIRFVKQLSKPVKYIILKSNATMAMAVIFGAIPLIYRQPLPVLSQFILMVVGGCLRLYISAWPADDLRAMSEKVAWSIYKSAWIGKSIEMQKSTLTMIRRAQKPLVISIVGVLPALTLQFYATFLSSTLSYFMTLRAVLGE